jgi:hypothetical protein
MGAPAVRVEARISRGMWKKVKEEIGLVWTVLYTYLLQCQNKRR